MDIHQLKPIKNENDPSVSFWASENEVEKLKHKGLLC